MLKNNGDVEEAMVVGEGLPYHVALIWIKRGFDRTGALTAIVQAVANINSLLDQLETRMVGVI